MAIFVVLLVLGFTLPGFVNQQGESDVVVPVEPRLCQADVDCYLTCDGQPQPALCAQNLCQQNACEEFAVYDYQKVPKTFSLRVNVDGVDKGFQSQEGDFFITAENSLVSLHTQRLPLGFIMEKLQVPVNPPCIWIENTPFCVDEISKIQFIVNGQEQPLNFNYIPQENDVVEIVFPES